MDALKESAEYVVVPREQVMVIDKVIEKLKHNNSGLVESPDDWEAVVLLFDLFKMEHPAHYRNFVETMKNYRLATKDTKAIIKDESGDMVHHVLEVPERFHNYMHAMFPTQKWDRKFTNKLIQALPILKVSGSL